MMLVTDRSPSPTSQLAWALTNVVPYDRDPNGGKPLTSPRYDYVRRRALPWPDYFYTFSALFPKPLDCGGCTPWMTPNISIHPLSE